MDYFDYTGKVAIVTGSSSGIGAAAAIKFAHHGALLTIIGRNEERLMQVAEACTKAKGNKPLCLILDLTKKDSCKEVVRKTVETYSKVDILVNAAGTLAMTSIYDESMENFDHVIAINLRVPYKMTQLCVPHLKKTKGVVVNIFASTLKVFPGLLVNSMIRDAMERFTKTVAMELASDGIRMNAVRPGVTRTKIISNYLMGAKIDDVYERISQFLPNKILIEPEEVAKVILFAANSKISNFTGSCINIDGATASS